MGQPTTGSRKLQHRINGLAQRNDSALDPLTQKPGATSPIIPRRCKRLSQPPDRYSPRIFFTEAGEPTLYEQASTLADSATWNLAMELEMNFI